MPTTRITMLIGAALLVLIGGLIGQYTTELGKGLDVKAEKGWVQLNKPDAVS